MKNNKASDGDEIPSEVFDLIRKSAVAPHDFRDLIIIHIYKTREAHLNVETIETFYYSSSVGKFLLQLWQIG